MARRGGPGSSGPIRDRKLLDALDRVPRRPHAGTVWRSVREGRDPLACWRSGGRWDDGTFDVLYTSETRRAAIEERRFHLYQGQPILPSRVLYELFELQVSLQAVMTFPSREELAALGLAAGAFGQLSYVEKDREYPRSQEMAEACSFLGSDGILVPSARDRSAMNLVVFCEQEARIEMAVVRSHGIIDWQAR